MVLLHYITVLAPAVGGNVPSMPHPAWQDMFVHTPLAFFWDGNLAVSLFFLISGTVLTGAFGDLHVHVPEQILRRLTRLGLPMSASVLLAAMWWHFWPLAHLRASVVMHHNPALSGVNPQPVTILGTLWEIGAGGMLFGHQDETLLPGILAKWAGLAPNARALNQPLWTLHLEFYGSLLVLLLVRLQARLTPQAFRRLFYALLVLFVMHPLDLFLIGFGAARLTRRPGWARFAASARGRALAVIALVLGICASSHGLPQPWGREFERICNVIRLPMRLDAFHAYGQYGAILLFFAVLALPGLQRGLGAALGRVLGRYSFSLYLVHVPILFTVTSALLVATAAWPAGWVLAVAGGIFVTIFVTLGFERWVDAPATRFSRRFGRSPQAAR